MIKSEENFVAKHAPGIYKVMLVGNFLLLIHIFVRMFGKGNFSKTTASTRSSFEGPWPRRAVAVIFVGACSRWGF